MSNENNKPKPQTDDLTKTEYGKTWAVSEDDSISYALSEILRAAMEDRTTPDRRGVLLYIANETKPIVVTGTNVIRLGRADSQSKPTVDLTKYHARELGVSRNHAEIVFSDGSYYIKDNGSVNGTWINSEKIQPYRQIQLSDSDQIRLGHFTMLVKFSL